MDASARLSVGNLGDRIAIRWDGVRWPRILGTSTAAAVIVYAAAVALPRYMLAGDLRREIESLAVRAEQVGDETTLVPPAVVAEKKSRLDRFIEPADLLPAVTGAARRMGLQLTAVKQMLPPTASHETRQIRLHAAASFDEVVGFVDEVVAISPTLRVDALNLLRPAGPGAGPVKLDLECSLSVEPRMPAQAGATVPEKTQ